MRPIVPLALLAVFTAELVAAEALPARRKSDKTKAGLPDASVGPSNYVRTFPKN